MIKLLVLLTKREPPSSRLRFRNCAAEFIKNGIEPTFLPIQSGPIDRFRLFLRSKDFDVIIIQKKTSFRKFELAFLRFLNPNIIFDYDDAVMFHELEQGQPLNGKNIVKFFRTIKYCKAVVAGNKFLSEFAKPNISLIQVLPTPINTEKYTIKNYLMDKKNIHIGWIGVSGNLKYIERIKPVFKEISKKHPNVVLKIISNTFISMDDVRTEFKKWRSDEEIEDLRNLDIGIMPLDDSLWTRGKCGYKILQYMGVGVPVVASPVGINKEFIKHGENGFLANALDEWFKYIDLLIINPDKRKKMGLNGREMIENKYSEKKYTKKYSNVIKGVISNNGAI